MIPSVSDFGQSVAGATAGRKAGLDGDLMRADGNMPDACRQLEPRLVVAYVLPHALA